jgi:Ca2+-binding RTX toxin-like protein
VLGENIENLVLVGSALVGTGNELVNSITGNGEANTLDGGSGADTLIGGAGDDTYIVDNVSDLTIENVDEGIDTVISSVTYVLGANVENLILSGFGSINGTGNALSNQLSGNTAANVLSGGPGDDTYFVGAGDTVVEGVNEGQDLVFSDVSWILGSNIENLTLVGTANINGTGNSLANILRGNNGTNVLDGGAGDDSYYVDAGDTVVESKNGGIDTVYASSDWTLASNLENLTLIGSAVSGTGNKDNNVLIGNSENNQVDGMSGSDTLLGGSGDDLLNGGSGSDVLDGGEGNDTLTGGTGVDAFYFSSPLGPTNQDQITDFSNAERLYLDHLIFEEIGALGNFVQNDPRFYSATGATNGVDQADRVVYDSASGRLYYDPDGSGVEPSSLFATLSNVPALSADHFAVI